MFSQSIWQFGASSVLLPHEYIKIIWCINSKQSSFFFYSGPYVKIDMKSGEIDGYDAVFLSPHKFVGGPGTPGILLMNKALYRLNSQPPSTCGGGTVAYVNGFNENVSIS